jgi:DNA-binding NarL/FixJ family response regulator
MSQPIRVLIAEQDCIMRTALRASTQSASDMKVVDDTGEVKEAIFKTLICQPDVLLLDLSLPKQEVAQFIQRIHSTAPNTHVLVLAVEWTPHIHKTVPMSKTASYLLKSASVAELLMAIRIVYHGGTVIPFALTRPYPQPKPAHGLTAIAHQLSTWRFSTTLRQIFLGSTR